MQPAPPKELTPTHKKQLKKLFLQYTKQDKTLKNLNYVKLLKNNNSLGPSLTVNRLDIIFRKFSDKKSKKMNFSQFLKSLAACAEWKKVQTSEFVDKIVRNSRGPQYKGTKAQNVRLHDDKYTYTGVYKKGGPKVLNKDEITLKKIVDRSKADVRGVNIAFKDGKKQG